MRSSAHSADAIVRLSIGRATSATASLALIIQSGLTADYPSLLGVVMILLLSEHHALRVSSLPLPDPSLASILHRHHLDRSYRSFLGVSEMSLSSSL
jgi:hypothetical protein